MDTILTLDETAALLRINVRTLQRLGTDGPPRINLATRRVGFWKSKVIAWAESRGTDQKRAA